MVYDPKTIIDEDEPDFFNLDKHRLDEELESQPKMMRKYTRQLAEAKNEARRAEAALKVVYAELDQKIRNREETKPTEVAIKNEITLSEKHRESQERCHKADHAVDILYGCVNTLDHRKDSLGQLVQLEGRGYYASKYKVPKEDKEEIRERHTKLIRNKGKIKRESV